METYIFIENKYRGRKFLILYEESENGAINSFIKNYYGKHHDFRWKIRERHGVVHLAVWTNFYHKPDEFFIESSKDSFVELY